MASSPIFSDLVMGEQTYIADKFVGIKHLGIARQETPEILNTAITYLYGNNEQYQNRNFPLLMATQGRGFKKPIASADLSFKVAVYGPPKKTSRIASSNYQAGDKPGIAYGYFEMRFTDRFFQKGQVIYSPGLGSDAIQAKIYTDLVKEGNEFVCQAQIITNKSTHFCPLKWLKAGVAWAGGVNKASLQRSEGTESRSQTSFWITNQFSLMRQSYSIEGNAANKVMKMEVKINGKSFKYYTELEAYQNEMRLNEAREADLLYSVYNKDSMGEIHLKDFDTDEVVPAGAGLYQQIVNSEYYSRLTERKFASFLQSMFFNMGGAQKKEFVLMGGTGFMSEADSALKAAAAGQFRLISDDKFIRPSGNKDAQSDGSLSYGTYFTAYQHISGNTVRFVYHPQFDHGLMANVAEKHPESGLPITSYNALALDFSTYNGEQNLMYLYEQGREWDEWYEAGGAKLPGVTMPTMRATGKDASKHHYLFTQGIHIANPQNCMKLFFKYN